MKPGNPSSKGPQPGIKLPKMPGLRYWKVLQYDKLKQWLTEHPDHTHEEFMAVMKQYAEELEARGEQ